VIDEKQAQEADAAITAAVTAFVSEFESMWGRWENVAPAYVIESTLLELCTELSVLAPDIKTVGGPATVKLLDALAAYRNSELTTADAAPRPDRWWSPSRRRGLTPSRPSDLEARRVRASSPRSS
jgi:hypothetical protein